jgi:Mrp family chromosome partitioning ATPase
MSTIHEAYSKKLEGLAGIEGTLSTLDRIHLFPLPAERQREELLQLANKILGFKPSGRGVILAFASTVAGEGTSFVSYNTSRELAHVLNRRVAWIDANFHSPQARLNILDDVSLAEMLRDPESFPGTGGDSKLTLIPGGRDLGGSISDLVSDRYPEVLRRFTELYDFTILDCPPIVNSVETELLAAGADGLIVVVEKSRLKWEVIKASLDQLASKRINILGTVFNRRTYDLPRVIYNRL